MPESEWGASSYRLITLHEVRRYLRLSHGVGLAVLIALSYALGSMLLGGMLVFARFSGGYSVLLIPNNALGLQSWNYPGLLIEAPWGFVELPFFATVAMLLVSAGVGLGMAVAILLAARLVADRKSAAGRPAATSAVAGLTPAMIALVTLGACCSVTAGATAGVGLVADASGSSTTNLLLNNWYLGVFQIAVVYLALIAQELLLNVYGGLFGTRDPAFVPLARTRAPIDRRALASGALRAGLLAAGVTWILAVLAAWTTVNPATASASLWFGWVVQHWLIGGLAVVAALSPETLQKAGPAFVTSRPGLALRGLLLLGAWSLAVWVPPPIAGAGVAGFGNEVLGLLGAPAAVGAVSPAFGWGVALALRWTFQYLLLASFAAAVGWSPTRVLDWLSEPDPRSLRNSVAGPTPATGAVPSDGR